MERVGIPPNIAEAIRRSREARTELRRRRRAAAMIAALGLATAVPISMSFADFGGSDIVEAAVARARGLADMLNQRSPGQRTSAELTKTKRKSVALAKMRPLVRKPVAPPLAPSPFELANILMPPPDLVPAPLGQVAIGPPPTLEAIVTPTPGSSIVIPPGGGGGTPGGGGGGPGGGPPATNPNPPAIVTPPVPEPATWMTMLLGFGLMGWRIRRARTSRPLAA